MAEQPIPCLSLWQPWASLLVGGRKRVETRGWPIRHRGRLLIHAAKKWGTVLADLCDREPFRSALHSCGVTRASELPFGAIVGTVDVIACHPTEAVIDDPYDSADQPKVIVGEGMGGRPCPIVFVGPTEKAFGDYSPGRFAILCANPVRFPTPVPFRGAQRLFQVPASVLGTSPAKPSEPAGLFSDAGVNQ